MTPGGAPAGVAAGYVRRATDSPSGTRESGGATVGIPVEGQLFVRPFTFLGLGIAGVANVNPRGSFAGLLVGLQVGRLHTRWERPRPAPAR